MINYLSRACVVAGLLALVGCSTNTQPRQPAPVIERPATTTPSQPAIVTPQPGAVPAPTTPAVAALSPAALSLAKQARQQYQVQDYQGAIATAERGLRIERRAPELYLILAQSYFQLALPEKARMFMQQGLRFAPQGSEAQDGLLRVKGLLGD